MTEDLINPLRGRMLKDMRIRGMGDEVRKFHIGAIEGFAKILNNHRDNHRQRATAVSPLFAGFDYHGDVDSNFGWCHQESLSCSPSERF